MSIAALVPKGKYFKLGDQGSAVKEIQLALRKLGYPLSGTGFFGNATDTAVEAFQKQAGCTVDGLFGNATAQALDQALSSDPKVIKTVEVSKEIGRPLWLQAGMRYIGTKETMGAKDNPVIINWAKDEGGEVAKTYTHDSIPWCALFANMCLTKVGLKGTESLWALDFAGQWPAVKLIGPAVGAFAPMLRDGGGHIGIVVGQDQNGNVMLLGGNQSDAVNIKPFARSRLNKGFWWPNSVPLPAPIGFSTLPVVKSDGKISSNEA
jgi:uncharacterized protein (TIGR02594 family)